MIPSDYLYFNSRDQLLRIEISRILYFESDGNYTNIVCTGRVKGMLGINLMQTERLLSERLKEKARGFVRIGKRYIVNLHYVYQINTLKQRIVLTDYQTVVAQIEVSKEALKKLKEALVADNNKNV